MTAPKTRSKIRNRIVELRYVKARDLAADPRNWRRHPSKQRRALRAMLADVGYADALLARETPEGLVLIDGHLRANLTPAQEVPVLVLDVDEAEAGRLLATLDPLADMAERDHQALEALLAEIVLPAGLEALLHEAEAIARSLGDPEVAPETRARPKVRLGDVWTLGTHRLMCGDATSAEDVATLLDGAKPELTVTDPPYGVDYDPAWRQDAAAKGLLSYAPTRVGEVANDDRSDWREAWLLSPSDVLYSWAPAGPMSADHVAALRAADFEPRMQIVWAKPHFPISRGHYHVRHEPCWYAVRKGATAHWRGGRDQTTLWEVALDPNADGGHSTQKPVELMQRPIRNHKTTAVYDPFVGSGTTIIAAEREGVACYAMDISPVWCDVALRRWEAFTGEKGQLVRRAGGRKAAKATKSRAS